MGDATQEEFPEVGNEVAEEAEEYPVADDEDLAGFGGEHEGSDLILGMMPLPLKVPRETPLLTMSLSDASSSDSIFQGSVLVVCSFESSFKSRNAIFTTNKE